jgi:V/A-type H+-transporting ATPase subunit E
MQGIENITSRIQADAQGEIDQILADAKAQAAEISARYDAQAKKESGEILSRGEKNVAEREERLTSVAQMETKKQTLAVKQEMLDKAFELAVDRLGELPEEKSVPLLAGLAAKASTTGREQLIFSQKDRARIGKAVVTAANEAVPKGQLTLSQQTAPIRGGFILSDGDVEVNCAFETLVRLQRDEIAGEVAKVLFG